MLLIILLLFLQTSALPPTPLALFLFNLTHTSGGPAALHHACFNAGGSPLLTTAFFGMNPIYANQYPPTCQSVLDLQSDFVLQSRDIIIVPEAWQDRVGVDPDYIANARSNGARGVSYILSIAGPKTAHSLQQLSTNGWIPIAHSHYTQQYFGIPWEPLIPALEPFIYTSASDDSKILPKENMIIIDDDARVIVTVPAQIGDISLHIVQLSGYTKPQVTNLYRRAKIVVDLYVNGLERATQEGILFGAYPIICATDNGLDQQDFNLPEFAKVDPRDGLALSTAITYIITHYDTDEIKIAYQPFKNFVVNTQTQSYISSSLIFRTSRRYQYHILLANHEYNSPASLLGALSLFQRHPLASIEIVVLSQQHATDKTRDVGLERYLRKHAPLMGKLSELGLTTREGGTIQYSLRIRGSNTLDPTMPSVIHGDYMVCVEEPIMASKTKSNRNISSLKVGKFVWTDSWFLDFNESYFSEIPFVRAVKENDGKLHPRSIDGGIRRYTSVAVF